MFFNNTVKSKNRFFGKIRLYIGHVIAYFYEPSMKMRSLRVVNDAFKSSYPGDRLSSAELKRLEEYQIDTMQLDLRMSSFEAHCKANTIEKTFYGSVIPLIREIINTDGNIKNVLNIGCNLDITDFLLSKEFKNINFKGIDFPKNIAEYNKSFLSENFTVISGYALDYLISTDLTFDIIYFSSTATNIKNDELHHYFKLLANKTRYIVFNEPLWIPPHKTTDLLDIDPNCSVPGNIYRDVIHDRFGYVSYNHNYKNILEKYGFNTIHYHTFNTDSVLQFTRIGRMQLIAKNTSEN